MLDFLLNNPFFFVIIIMALSSLFGSGKKQKTEQRSQGEKPSPSTARPSQPPSRQSQSDTQSTETVFDKWRREIERQMTPPETKPVQTVVQKVERPVQPVEERKSDRQKQLENEYKQLEKVLTEKQTRNSSVQMKMGTVTKSKVVEGIIWSEILGAPRSRKPFKPNGYRN